LAHHTLIPLFNQRPRQDAGEVLRAVPRGGGGGANSLYIHVPFCFHKCHYCDFYSIVDTQDRQTAFTMRLVEELGALAPWVHPSGLNTIFIGGGTPSLLRTDLWTVLLDRLDALFQTRHGGGAETAQRDGFEFTVECNPETVSPELMSELKRGGVTRVSIGAQSFEQRHLKTLERWHDPANVARALELARAAGISRQSIDLIYAVPGQTLVEWDQDLTRALSMGTEHLSCYSLTYEPATAMTARLKRGEFKRADEDLEADMFELTLARLRSAGLDRYEVSNFSLPGRECRHNMAYWRQEDWLAAGPAASAHIAGRRWKNVPRLDDYLTQGAAGFSPIMDFEEPDAARALAERLMTGLRVTEGLDSAAMLAKAADVSPLVPNRLSQTAEHARNRGLLKPDHAHWALTDAGFLVADTVALEFMEAVG